MSATVITQPAKRVTLTEIAPVAFQHPLDAQATTQLSKIPHIDKAVSWYLKYGVERLAYFMNTASNVRVGPRQLPKLYAMLLECCEVLDVPEPALYVSQGGVNAFTFGHDDPYIVLEAGLVDLMEDDELVAVLGHELGHIKCGHVLYKMMARSIQPLAEVAGELTFGIGALVGASITGALLLWDRRSELSADRAALLVTQEARPCVTMLMKLAAGTSRLAAQLDPEAFLEQARAYGGDKVDRTSDRIYRLAASMYKGTHPFAVERAKALNEWVDGREFEQILAGAYARRRPEEPQTVGYCPGCGIPVHPTYMFCAGCGRRLKAQ